MLVLWIPKNTYYIVEKRGWMDRWADLFFGRYK